MRKKTYQKPLLYAESYELSQHIAACDIKITSASVMQCTGESSADSIFGYLKNLFTEYTTGNICRIHFESYCYTNGVSGFATHMS